MADTESTTPPPPDDDWLLPADADDGALDPYAGPAPPFRRRQWLTSGGLLAAGAVAGVVIVLAAGHGGSSPSATQFTPAVSVPGAANGQNGIQPGLPPGRGDDGAGDDGGRFVGAPGGGLDGEQRLQGTLTQVGDSTITVATGTGTSTYAVNGATQIVRNGAVVGLGSLKVGDPVLVHVYPAGSGGRLLAERIFAGNLPAFPGAPGGGAPPAGTAGGTKT